MAELAEGTSLEGSQRHASPECTEQQSVQHSRGEEGDAQSSCDGIVLLKKASSFGKTDLDGGGNSATSTPAAHRQVVMDEAKVAAGDSAVAVQGPRAALEAKSPEANLSKDGEQMTKPSAELTSADSAAATAPPHTHNSVAAGHGDRSATHANLLSNMPPPSLLPRQLRSKRGGVAKVGSLRSSRVQAAPTSAVAENASASSSVGAGGQCAEHQAYWERGKMEGDAASSAAASTGSGDTANTDDEFLLFMKEIEQLDSQRQVEHAGSQSAEGKVPRVPPSQKLERSSPSLEPPPASLGTPKTPPQQAKNEPEQLDEQRAAPRPEWQAVVDTATGKTYYWDVTTDQVTWEMPRELAGEEAVDEAPSDPHSSDLQHWAEATFKLTQDLPTSNEKVQQLIFQLDFMESELDAMYEGLASAKPKPAPEEVDISTRLQRFRSLKRQREPTRPRRSREAKAAGSDDELLKELIDLHLQQDRPQAPWQCPRCKRCNAEPRTQPQQAEIRSLASSLARRLGRVEKEWAAAMLAALKARLEDWIDGGLNGSFFLQRLEKMQQEFQKHLSHESEAEGRQQELASVFPYSASAAAVASSATSKTSPRNCLASAVAAASSEKVAAARHQAGSKIAATAPKREPLTPSSAPPTPAGPPPTLPDDVPSATAEGTQTEEARAPSDIKRDGEIAAATSRDGAQAPAATVVTGKRNAGSIGSKKVTSSNPLVRRRMQLVEKWQKSRQMDEESEEEDYEQRKERQKQRKIDEWKEREMASRRGMNNANFIEVTADWRSLVGKK